MIFIFLPGLRLQTCHHAGGCCSKEVGSSNSLSIAAERVDMANQVGSRRVFDFAFCFFKAAVQRKVKE